MSEARSGQLRSPAPDTRSAPSPRSLRGEGWGEGRRLTRRAMPLTPPSPRPKSGERERPSLPHRCASISPQRTAPAGRGMNSVLLHRQHCGIAACGLVLALLLANAARAQSVEQFYKGRALTMLVGLPPAASTTSLAVWSRDICPASFPVLQLWWCRAIPVPAAWSPSTGSISTRTEMVRSSPALSGPSRSSRSRAIRTHNSIRRSSPG